MIELKPGEQIPLDDGGSVEIIEEIGSGGQGSVYRVRWDDGEYALKWYRPSKISKPKLFRSNLERNIIDGAPASHFLWPLKLTKGYKGAFGYLMRLRPDEYVDFAAILDMRTQFPSLHVMLLAALDMVDGFRSLHRQGKCYQDLNDGNFFINADTGEILICDNDNVTPDRTDIGMAGMPGYMAPEIVRGDAKPDTQTDYHSLAVVLFKLLMRHDPYLGKAFVEKDVISEEAERELYGVHPVFIFDPQDESNRPLPDIHPNPLALWPTFPDYVRDAFAKVFADGAKSPKYRLDDNQWRDILLRLKGEILSCQCGHEFLLSHVAEEAKNGIFRCPGCGCRCSMPMSLDATGLPVHLYPGTRFGSCHAISSSADYRDEIAIVVRNKNNPSAWGLRNAGNMTWRVRRDGAWKPVTHGEVVPLRDGLEIMFGKTMGKISAHRH